MENVMYAEHEARREFIRRMREELAPPPPPAEEDDIERGYVIGESIGALKPRNWLQALAWRFA